MSKKLSGCIIARDEEKSIEKSIKSILDICDEIIVLDTGSRDDTVSIAERLGAKVYHHKWNNDYQEARNVALDKCTMDWIFVIDGDEELEKGYGELLKKLIVSTEKEGIYLDVKNFVGANVVNEELMLRVFRNNPNYRYVYKYNEEIYSSIKSISGSTAFEITDYVINHYGLDEKVVDVKNKMQRNMEVLSSYKDEEKDSGYYIGLGDLYSKKGEYREAANLLEKGIKIIEKKDSLRVHAVIGLCNVNYKLGKYITALNCIDKYLKEFPSLRGLYFLKSACNNELMRYTRSYVALKMFIAIPPDVKKYPTFNFGVLNDVDSLVIILGALRVPHDSNLLTVIIEVNNKMSQYIDAIKNVNEISDDVIVANTGEDSSIREKAYELGATTYNYKNTLKNQWQYEVGKKAKGKWILYLDENRVINYEERAEVVKIIKECNKENIKELDGKYRLIKKNALERLRG